MTLYLAGLTAIFFTGCATKAQQSFDRPPAPVTVATVVTQDVPTYLDAIGKTVARELVAIQPQVSGRIVQIHFTDGADVKKNDMLFTIDTRPLEATLRQAQANYIVHVAHDFSFPKKRAPLGGGGWYAAARARS